MAKRPNTKFLILLAVCLLFDSFSGHEEAMKGVSRPIIEVMVNGDVQIPCEAPLQKVIDAVEFVFWYKDDEVIPLYAVDAREAKSLELAHHSRYGRKTSFDIIDESPFLQIKDLKSEDSGTYFCRVDYQWSSTLMDYSRLQVVVPTEKLIIRNESGQEVKKSVGPFKEGDNMTLSCEALGGIPDPNVTWYRGDKVWDNTFKNSTNGMINQMTVTNLQRADAYSEFHCEAKNTELRGPVSRSVMVDLTLPVTKVRISLNSPKLVAGRWEEVMCEAYGSAPPAKLSWYLNGTKLSGGQDHIVTDNYTSSILRFRPTADYHRGRLTCRAENDRLKPKGYKEDSVVLDVMYKPVVSIRVTKDDNGLPPHENDYIRLSCQVNSNPRTRLIGWFLDGRKLNQGNTTADMSNVNSIVFKGLAIDHQGVYRCYATNTIGTGESEDYDLPVYHAPVCKKEQQITYSAFLFHQVTIRCEVEANPSNVTFRWEFANSASKRFDLTHLTIGTVSYATYTPKSMADYGTVFCWANNSVGHQRSSCFFTVISPNILHPPVICNTDMQNRSVTGNGTYISCPEPETSFWEGPTFIGITSTVSLAVLSCGVGIFVRRKIQAKRQRNSNRAQVQQENADAESGDIDMYNIAQVAPADIDEYPPGAMREFRMMYNRYDEYEEEEL